MRGFLLAQVFVSTALWGCTTDGGGGVDPCASLCACMGQAEGQDVADTCRTQCADQVAQGATHADCVSQVEANGFGSCASSCPTDPSMGGGPGVADAGPRNGDPCSYSSYDCDPSCQESCGDVSCVDLCCRDSTRSGVLCDGSCVDTCGDTPSPEPDAAVYVPPDAAVYVAPDAAPPPAGCSDPEHPVACPGQHGVADDCWTPETNCASIVACNGTPASCAPGFTVDCATLSCDPIAAGLETGAEACSNGLDDDGNGFTDCADFHCRFDAAVTACQGETTDFECSDGIDNDGNGAADCQDAGCLASLAVTVCGPPEHDDTTCADGLDNDGNGYIDCHDYSCLGSLVVSVCARP